MTPTTRRYPRTMTEAFGPYHHLAPLHVEYPSMGKHDKILVWCCAVILGIAGAVVYFF